MQLVSYLSQLTGIPTRSIEQTLKLLDEGSTIPFIARYRKEMTGNLDEVQIYTIQKEHEKIVELEKRRQAIQKSIEDQGKLTPELKSQILQAKILSELEDIYLPYKPKKRTKAQIAIEHGLLPLAEWILKQRSDGIKPYAQKFVNADVPNAEAALQGSMEILSEQFSEDIAMRSICRESFEKYAILKTKKKRTTKAGEDVYKDYFDFSERLNKSASHRVLACFRGAHEGVLNINIEIDPTYLLQRMERKYVRGHFESSDMVYRACEKAFDDHLQPQMESEFCKLAKEKADKESIAIFGKNLKQLLLAAPLGQKRIMGIDPGFRTGCKVVCLDYMGNLLHHDAIFPHPPKSSRQEAEYQLIHWVDAYQIEAIAIGNGTAGRETEDFVLGIKEIRNKKIDVFLISEAGASIYSASAVAREEFPKEDVTVRGAVSIARRLMDPLAELVKIDPKSIGVGQYQHDVNQPMLKEELDQIVISAVNAVGVDLNTASKYLLQYVSGLGPSIAQNIIEFRKEHGGFRSREDLKKVPRLGSKVYEQCAGFLRIQNGASPLDNTAIHPEKYKLVEKIAKKYAASLPEFISNKAVQKKVMIDQFVDETTGRETLKDIMTELAKPGRDPRAEVSVVAFDAQVRSIEDLTIGKVLTGVVTNLTNFGTFVNIGIKQDGLVHISEMSHTFVKDPNEVVVLNQQVQVKVIEIDLARKRVQLSMKQV